MCHHLGGLRAAWCIIMCVPPALTLCKLTHSHLLTDSLTRTHSTTQPHNATGRPPGGPLFPVGSGPPSGGGPPQPLFPVAGGGAPGADVAETVAFVDTSRASTHACAGAVSCNTADVCQLSCCCCRCSHTCTLHTPNSHAAPCSQLVVTPVQQQQEQCSRQRQSRQTVCGWCGLMRSSVWRNGGQCCQSMRGCAEQQQRQHVLLAGVQRHHHSSSSRRSRGQAVRRHSSSCSRHREA